MRWIVLLAFMAAGLAEARASEEERRLPPPVVRPAGPGAPVAAPPVRAPEASPPPPAPRAPYTLPAARPVPAPPPTPVPTLVSPRIVRPSRPLLFDARGPFEIRDEWLLAQPRLTLPAVSPDPLGAGCWTVALRLNMGNDFGWDQSGPAEMPVDRRFLVDGEHRTFELDVRHGLTRALDVGLRVPLRWRGGGFMDDIIDWFHDLTEPIGFLDNGRPDFRTDAFRVQGRDDRFRPIAWTEQGTGLGNVELDVRWAFLRPETATDWRAALVLRTGLPTGTGPFETGSVDAGAQLALAKRLGRSVDVYAGFGGTFFSDDEIDGIVYEDLRASGFLAVEWRPASTWSLFVQGDLSSRLVENLARYPGIQAYIHVGAKIDLGRRWRLELGFTENLEDQQATIDFGVFAGLELRL